MMRASAEERALARASMYRALSLAFSYPTAPSFGALTEAVRLAEVAAPLTDASVAAATAAMAEDLAQADAAAMEADFKRTFTLSYSEDCPPYETAFSASHLFQQSRHQADIAGFYRAFGVQPQGDRPDHLSMELEFCYLLALKEASARRERDRAGVAVCRDAQRAFLREHLARWAPSIAARIAVASSGPYASAAKALAAFVRWEEGFLRLGGIERFSDEPFPVDQPEEFSCPADLPIELEEVSRAAR